LAGKTAPVVCSSTPNFTLVARRVASAGPQIANLTEFEIFLELLYCSVENRRATSGVLFHAKLHGDRRIAFAMSKKLQVLP